MKLEKRVTAFHDALAGSQVGFLEMLTPAGPAEFLPGDRSLRAVVKKDDDSKEAKMVDPRVERTSYV